MSRPTIAFAMSVGTAAGLYDFQAAPENLEQMTFQVADQRRAGQSGVDLPKTYGDLVRRRQAIEKWSMLSCGMIGRSPDHVASTLAGFQDGAG